MKLTNNFTLEEMFKSQIATRLGINNIPGPREIENLQDLCINILQPARDHFGRINVSSGYRSLYLCEEIGSSKTSNHIPGFAADSEVDDPEVTNFEYLLWIYENCEFKELIAEYFDMNDPKAGWVHAAYEEGNNKRELKLKDKDHDYIEVSIDYLKSLYS